MSKSKTNNETSNNQLTQQAHDNSVPNSLPNDDYSHSCIIARAYSAGYFPSFSHQKLFQAILKMLNGNNEGNIDFCSLLAEAHMHRSSAIQIIKHMVAWNILAVSFNSSQNIGEKKKSWAFVKILHNPETHEQHEDKIPQSS